MRRTFLASTLAAGVLALTALAPSALADSAKPGTSMTHIKTAPGLASTLEGAGVVLYTQGGATSAVMGDGLDASNGQVVFHVPITGTKAGLKHAGSVLVLFNTATNKQVQLVNPVIDLAKAEVRAAVPGVSSKSVPVLTIANAKKLKPVVKTVDGVKTTTYTGADLTIADGVASVITSGLGLPAGALSDGAKFGTADVTLVAP